MTVPTPASEPRAPVPPCLSGPEAARRNLAVARWSLGVAGALALLKVVAAALTGSLALLASLVDSVMDLLASTANYLAVRLAGRPADREHAYGHGKAEALAGLVQAGVVGFSGAFLLVEGLRRLLEGGRVVHEHLGVGVMAVSTLASVWIVRRLRATARRTGSLALRADAVHYASDVWTNLGVLVALVAVALTGWLWVDGAAAAVVAAVVLGTALRVLKRSADELMDRGLPPPEVEALLAAVRREVPETRGLHDVRTRRAGPTVFLDCHALFDRQLSFVEAHRLSERVRLAVERARPGARVTVHADPHPLRPGDLDPDPRIPYGV